MIECFLQTNGQAAFADEVIADLDHNPQMTDKQEFEGGERES
jgi:hypothetical protein